MQRRDEPDPVASVAPDVSAAQASADEEGSSSEDDAEFWDETARAPLRPWRPGAQSPSDVFLAQPVPVHGSITWQGILQTLMHG